MTMLYRFARRLSMPHLSAHAKLLIAVGCALTMYGGASALASLGDEMLAQPMPSGNRFTTELALQDLDAQTEKLAAQDQRFVAAGADIILTNSFGGNFTEFPTSRTSNSLLQLCYTIVTTFSNRR